MSRPRRLFLALLSLPVLFLLFLFLLSASNLFSTDTPPSKLPDEIFGLLHFVTSPDEAGRWIGAVWDPPHDYAGPGIVALEHDDDNMNGGAIVPEEPIPMTWYALGSIAKTEALRIRGGPANVGWEERLRVLHEQYPLVVFSKSYCPYSKRAQRLLETYGLLPAPKIIQVDLRADASQIKTLLARLTHRSTFPNVILHGRSLGGSDELARLHEEGQLQHQLEQAGIKFGWSEEGGEDLTY